MATESASAQAAASPDHSQQIQLAEQPKGGEGWSGMVERQQREGTNKGGFSRELMRSLPAEQKGQKENPPDKKSLFAPEEDGQQQVINVAWLEQLREASERRGPDNQMER